MPSEPPLSHLQGERPPARGEVLSSSMLHGLLGLKGSFMPLLKAALSLHKSFPCVPCFPDPRGRWEKDPGLETSVSSHVLRASPFCPWVCSLCGFPCPRLPGWFSGVRLSFLWEAGKDQNESEGTMGSSVLQTCGGRYSWGQNRPNSSLMCVVLLKFIASKHFPAELPYKEISTSGLALLPGPTPKTEVQLAPSAVPSCPLAPWRAGCLTAVPVAPRGRGLSAWHA